MSQEITDLNSAADAIIAQNKDLKATVASQAATITELQTQVANSIQPSDITPVTQKLNDEVAAT